MILGIGTDMVVIERITCAIDRYDERFVNRIFTPAERDQARGRLRASRFLATRFAAKEAIWKAIGGDFKYSISWRDMEILADQNGAPQVKLYGNALASAKRKARESWQLDLSLSDDGGIALAFAVFSAS